MVINIGSDTIPDGVTIHYSSAVAEPEKFKIKVTLNDALIAFDVPPIANDELCAVQHL